MKLASGLPNLGFEINLSVDAGSLYISGAVPCCMLTQKHMFLRINSHYICAPGAQQAWLDLAEMGSKLAETRVKPVEAGAKLVKPGMKMADTGADLAATPADTAEVSAAEGSIANTLWEADKISLSPLAPSDPLASLDER